jgi:hypothetical protein
MVQEVTTHVIAAATPADVGEIAPLFDLYRQFYGKTANEEAARRFLFARLSKGESVIFYARHQGSPVAFLQLYPVFSSVHLSRQWILNDLYVLQGHVSTAMAERWWRALIVWHRTRRPTAWCWKPRLQTTPLNGSTNHSAGSAMTNATATTL